jgi:hypothetical protein
MNKDILNFNKEIVSEIKGIIKKCQDYEKELILKSSKDKSLDLEILNEGKYNQSYFIKNIHFIKELIENKKIKLISRMASDFVTLTKVYLFEDLLILEKKGTYKVILKDGILNLYEYESGYEALDSFLNKHIEDEED